MSGKNLTSRLCIACCDLFAVKRSVNKCPKCGSAFDSEAYDRLAAYAGHATMFGYRYRRVYERQLAEGRNARFALGIDDAFVFVGIAAISGIIGNASWDVLKKAVSAVLSRAPKAPLKESELEGFISYLAEFHRNGVSGLPPELADRIMEEMRADEVAETLHRIGKNRSPTPDEIRDAVRAAFRAETTPPTANGIDVSSFASRLHKARDENNSTSPKAPVKKPRKRTNRT